MFVHVRVHVSQRAKRKSNQQLFVRSRLVRPGVVRETTHPKPRTESRIVVARAAPHRHAVLVEEIIPMGPERPEKVGSGERREREQQCNHNESEKRPRSAWRSHANREALDRLDAPFAFGGVPEDGRDHTESRKSLVRVLHALVLVRAVAMITSGWARSLGCAHAGQEEKGRGAWSVRHDN